MLKFNRLMLSRCRYSAEVVCSLVISISDASDVIGVTRVVSYYYCYSTAAATPAPSLFLPSSLAPLTRNLLLLGVVASREERRSYCS